MTILLKAICALMVISTTMLAQVGPAACDSTSQFIDLNVIDYTVKVRTIKGRVFSYDGAGIPKACIALFNSDHSKLVRVFESGENGEFTTKDIKSGDYWLVVQDSLHAYCPASARLKLRRISAKSKIVVNMRGRQLDACSFCEAK